MGKFRVSLAVVTNDRILGGNALRGNGLSNVVSIGLFTGLSSKVTLFLLVGIG